MKRKLCFVIPSMSRGGAERVMSILVNNAIKQGYEVNLVLLSQSKVEYELDESVNIIKISESLKFNNGIKRTLERFLTLKNILKKLHPDLVVSFLTTCNIYVSLALGDTKIPCVLSERNDPIQTCTSHIKKVLRNYCYRRAHGIVFQTVSAKEYFNKKIQQGSVVIPNPVKNHLPFVDVVHSQKKIVAAARLMPQKNYPMLLKAFRLFLDEHPDYTLHIFGDGDLKEALVTLAKELSISENVMFEGNVPDLHERIRDAKMFVLSSDYEGISNSLLEALAMGLPCVSTDCPCGGSRMLIEDGISGFLTPVGNEVAFYQAMRKITDNDELALAFSQNARQVRELYSEDIIVGKYFDYFEEVMKKNKT